MMSVDNMSTLSFQLLVITNPSVTAVRIFEVEATVEPLRPRRSSFVQEVFQKLCDTPEAVTSSILLDQLSRQIFYVRTGLNPFPKSCF
jgi:hypothetical protein